MFALSRTSTEDSAAATDSESRVFGEDDDDKAISALAESSFPHSESSNDFLTLKRPNSQFYHGK